MEKIWDELQVFTQETIYHVHSKVRQSLDSIIPILSKFKVSRLAICSWAGRFESYLVQTSDERFSGDVAQFSRSSGLKNGSFLVLEEKTGQYEKVLWICTFVLIALNGSIQ